MYSVRFTPYRRRLGEICARQTKNRSLVSLDGRYRFFIDGIEPQSEIAAEFADAGRHIENPDFWVVQGKGLRAVSHCRVAAQNTVFLATEPRSVLVYPEDYLRQFGVVCTCQSRTLSLGNRNGRPKVAMGPPVLPWFVGFEYGKDGQPPTISLDYDNLLSMPTPHKTKLLSVITSDKAFTEGHIRRLRFVKKLQERYGDSVDIYGHGFLPVPDKWDALAPYRYHIVIENSAEPYYWTEKLSDALLAECFPFYYGCTNIADYIPRSAYRPIDILKPEEAFATIDNAINANLQGQCAAAIHEAKLLMLNRYNMFEAIARVLDGLDPALPKQDITLRPCRSWHSPVNLWRYLAGRQLYELKWKLLG